MHTLVQVWDKIAGDEKLSKSSTVLLLQRGGGGVL